MLDHTLLRAKSHDSMIKNLKEVKHAAAAAAAAATSVSNEKMQQSSVEKNILQYLLEYLNEGSTMNT